MCRHLAYLGPPVTLRSLIIDPPHGLFRQSWQPRRQQHGTVNADGFGVGWWAPGDPVPARYRSDLPIWADESFADVARVTASGAVLAAVRSASARTSRGAPAVAPYAADGWLFSHNGRLDGWPRAADGIAATLPASALLDLDARVDSALLWALIRHRLRDGMPAGGALADTIAALASAGITGRFNFLLSNGETIAASAVGDTLSYKWDSTSILVASEPADDTAGWHDLPDWTVITASLAGVITHSVINGVNGKVASR